MIDHEAKLTRTALDWFHAHKYDDGVREVYIDLLGVFGQDDHLPTAMGTMFRGSDLNPEGCRRQIAFAAEEWEPDFDFSGGARLNFDVGTMTHAQIQTGLHFLYGYELERKELLLNGLASGHIDACLYGEEVVEIKTMSGFAYERVAGRFYRGQYKEGNGQPERSHLLQASLYAEAIGAPTIRFIYVAKHKSETFVELVVPPDVALVEEARVMAESIRMQLEHDLLPERTFEGRLVTSVPGSLRGQAPREDGSLQWPKPFLCGSCRWRDTCADLPSEAVPFTRKKEVA